MSKDFTIEEKIDLLMTWTIEINKIFKSRNVSNVNVSSAFLVHFWYERLQI